MELKSIDDSNLELWKVIGSGGFGQVFKVRHKRWGDVAIKVLHQSDSLAFDKEVRLMCKAKSSHVVQIRGKYTGHPLGMKSSTPVQGLVMEYMERGSLDSLLKHLDGPPPWPLVLRLAHNVAVSLNFLHGLTPQILHLDLKPSNVLLDSNLNAKVTDFGLAKILRLSQDSFTSSLSMKEVGGTTSYMPPEAFGTNYKPTPASDVYSYAILLCSIIKGGQPYPHAISSVVKLRIPDGDRPDLDKLPFRKAKGLDELVLLIKECWKQDPQARPAFFDCMNKTKQLLEPLKSELSDAVHEVLKSLELSGKSASRLGDRGTPVMPGPPQPSRQINVEVLREAAAAIMRSQQWKELEKRYDPRDRSLKFVSRPDDIILDDDPNTPRVEMSCGHAVTPQSLTAWCRSLLDQGQYKFMCPALKDGTLEQCGKEWPYQEVRKLALLTDSEQRHFEETMAALAAAEFCEYKSCSGCHSSVERENSTNLSVNCMVCTDEMGLTYDFCWQCLKHWKGPGPRSDHCDNDGCTDWELDLLQKCPMTTLPSVENVQCPSIRACPTCALLIEHDKTGNKSIICSRCCKEFCFVCLKLTPECLQTSRNYNGFCSDGVAPRQTSVPTRKRN